MRRGLSGTPVIAALLLALLVASFASAAPRDPAPVPATEEAASAASHRVASLLAQMTAAMRKLDYQGSFIYEHDGRVDALRVFHAGGAKERERLVGLTGPRSEIVRDGNSVTSIQADAQPTVFTSSASTLPLPSFDADATALTTHYRLRLAGEDRVAGYRAQQVEVLPRDAFRYGYRLWLERDSHMLLRSQVIGQDGTSLEHFMFVALEIGARPRPGDLLPSRAGNARARAAEIGLDGTAHWRILRLPPGFELIGRRTSVDAPQGAEHLTWTDGLANASLYVEPRASSAAGPVIAMSRGALSVYSSDVGSWRVTALGNVPAVTVEMLVRSLTPVVQPR